MWRDYILAILLAGLSMFMPRQVHADLLYEGDDGVVRVTSLPCPPEVLNVIPQGDRGYFRLALANIGGVRMPTCAAPGEVKAKPGVQHIIVVRSDGRWWAIPLDAMNPAPNT